jgi:hypothetical protein
MCEQTDTPKVETPLEQALRGLDGLSGYSKLHMTSCQGESDARCTCWPDRMKLIGHRVRSVQAILIQLSQQPPT